MVNANSLFGDWGSYISWNEVLLMGNPMKFLTENLIRQILEDLDEAFGLGEGHTHYMSDGSEEDVFEEIKAKYRDMI